jgi:hypothetical protein
MKLINFFLVKKLSMYKGKIFPKNFVKTMLFMVWIKSRNRNRNLSKDGTVTFQKLEPEPGPSKIVRVPQH